MSSRALERVVACRPLLSPRFLPKADFILDLLKRFYDWAQDLPASENYHHAYAYGLFTHSFEVACDVVQELQVRWGSGTGAAHFTPAEETHWFRVAFAIGLFHDCGKLLDLDVKMSEIGSRWDPLQESLAGFRRRHGVHDGVLTPYEYHVGRGTTGHERRGLPLIPVILEGPRWDGLRAPVTEGLTLYAGRHGPDQPMEVPLSYLVYRVQEADIRSARRDRRRDLSGQHQREEARR